MIPKQIISQQDMRDAHMSEINGTKMQSCAITIKAGSYWSARQIVPLFNLVYSLV